MEKDKHAEIKEIRESMNFVTEITDFGSDSVTFTLVRRIDTRREVIGNELACSAETFTFLTYSLMSKNILKMKVSDIEGLGQAQWLQLWKLKTHIVDHSRKSIFRLCPIRYLEKMPGTKEYKFK